jgi:hypothetical protein
MLQVRSGGAYWLTTNDVHLNTVPTAGALGEPFRKGRSLALCVRTGTDRNARSGSILLKNP